MSLRFGVLVAAGSALTFAAVWWSMGETIYVPTTTSWVAIAPPGFGLIAEPASVASRDELQQTIQHMDPFVGGGISAIGDGSLTDLDQPCVDALIDRANALRGRSYRSLAAGPSVPAPHEDTCRAEENSHLIGKDMNYLSQHSSDISAERFRWIGMLAHPWLTPEVRRACENWIDPQRLNLENFDRLWCG